MDGCRYVKTGIDKLDPNPAAAKTQRRWKTSRLPLILSRTKQEESLLTGQAEKRLSLRWRRKTVLPHRSFMRSATPIIDLAWLWANGGDHRKTERTFAAQLSPGGISGI